jgi:type II secretory pathway component PulM
MIRTPSARVAEPAPVGGGRLSSLTAPALAFLASQHHNFMMLLLAFGLGDAAMHVMTAAPRVREVMLGMSLAMVGVIAYQIRDAKRPASIRVIGVISILVTLGLLAWSLARFGL